MSIPHPKEQQEVPDTIPSTSKEGSKTDPNMTELKGFTDSDMPLEPTEPDPDEVPDDETAA